MLPSLDFSFVSSSLLRILSIVNDVTFPSPFFFFTIAFLLKFSSYTQSHSEDVHEHVHLLHSQPLNESESEIVVIVPIVYAQLMLTGGKEGANAQRLSAHLSYVK